jgi:hypothetical protein
VHWVCGFAVKLLGRLILRGDLEITTHCALKLSNSFRGTAHSPPDPEKRKKTKAYLFRISHNLFLVFSSLKLFSKVFSQQLMLKSFSICIRLGWDLAEMRLVLVLWKMGPILWRNTHIHVYWYTVFIISNISGCKNRAFGMQLLIYCELLFTFFFPAWQTDVFQRKKTIALKIIIIVSKLFSRKILLIFKPCFSCSKTIIIK